MTGALTNSFQLTVVLTSTDRLGTNKQFSNKRATSTFAAHNLSWLNFTLKDTHSIGTAVAAAELQQLGMHMSCYSLRKSSSINVVHNVHAHRPITNNNSVKLAASVSGLCTAKELADHSSQMFMSPLSNNTNVGWRFENVTSQCTNRMTVIKLGVRSRRQAHNPRSEQK